MADLGRISAGPSSSTAFGTSGRRARRGVVALILSFALACAASPPRPADELAIGSRLAADPQDWAAHRALAELRFREGLVGEALRELLLLHRAGRLDPSGRALLRPLVLERAQERLTLDDPGALADLRLAKELGAEADLAEGLALAAVAALRHSSHFEQKRAASYLKRLGALRPDDPRVSHDVLTGKSREEMVSIFEWFSRAGARRWALQVSQRYIDSGGRELDMVTAWIDLHRWWFGDRRPPLPTSAAQLVADDAPLERFAAAMRLRSEGRPKTRTGLGVELAASWGVREWGDDLALLERAFRTDPALSDRETRRFVDRNVYGARERAIAAELFYRLGDKGRARRWSAELGVLSDKMPPFLLSAGLGCAADADPHRAGLLFTAAAASSGDPGRYWGVATRGLRLADQLVAALEAGKKSLTLTAKGRDTEVLFEIILAQEALGRSEDAARTRKELWTRFTGQALRWAESETERAIAAETRAAGAESMLGAIRVELGFPYEE